MNYDESIKDKLIDINYDSIRYQEELEKLNKDLQSNEKFVKEIFDMEFKIRGILAKIDDYSIHGNWINVHLIKEGIDNLTLTFIEFANQIEFVNLMDCK